MATRNPVVAEVVASCDADSCTMTDSYVTGLCDDSTGVVICTCEAGHYSPSGDATKNKDCTIRSSQALIGFEFTAGSDYRFKDGKFQYSKRRDEWRDYGNANAGRVNITKTIIMIIVINEL